MMNRTGYVIFHEKGKAGLKDAQGNVVLAPEYDKILDYDDDGYIRVLKGHVYGTVDFEGREVIPHSLGLTHLGVFHQHTARAMKDGRWGIVDERGREVAPFCYALMEPHRRWGYTVTTIDGQRGVVDEKGNFTPSQEKGSEPKTSDGKQDKKLSKDDVEGLHAMPKDVWTVRPKIPNAKSFFYSLRRWTGDFFNHLQFYYRDTDAPIDVDKVYKKGNMIRCGAEMEVTPKLMRPVHKLRLMIAAPELFNVGEYARRLGRNAAPLPLEEYVIGRNLFFIVLDVFHYAGMVQVLFLQLPHNAIVFAKTHFIKITPAALKAKGPDDEPLIEYARHDLQEKAAEPVHGYSLSEKWEKKMTQPIGVDQDLRPVELETEKVPIPENKENSVEQWLHYRANVESYFWSKSLCVEEAESTIKVKWGDASLLKADVIIDATNKANVRAGCAQARKNKWESIVFSCKKNRHKTAFKTKVAQFAVEEVMRHFLCQQRAGSVTFCCETEEDAVIYRNVLKENL